MQDRSAVTTFLFTDIEGSTRLWEGDPERMRYALARHDALARTAIGDHRGSVVKMTGDGVCAAFEDSLDAVGAALQLQRALADPAATHGVTLRVRCGMHAGIVEHRDNDYFGSVLNRAARIMGAAHGGQVLVSQAVAFLIRERLAAGVTLRDMGAVRLRDLASAERVYQVLHPQLRQDFPALRSLEATPNNLPRQVTSFIGRERELREVKQWLGKAGLVTLLGAGGLGKSRLSAQVAADVLDDFPDGAWFVELAPLADARLVPQAVASVLGVKEDAGRPVEEALLRFVKDRRLLLILDNCEHLLQSCADLSRQLLQSGPDVKLLASSREPLHVAGEMTYPLPPLALPDAHGKIVLADLTQCEAIHLFADRAIAVRPGFRVSESNARALIDICQRLDGIPLAIELAAARVRALSVETIAERLSDRFRLLTGGDRTALPRQQTLRASIDWSYDLLTDAERTLLRRLAVFAGGWTLEAAEAVGAGGAIDRVDALDRLTHLVDKSLVTVEADGERYGLLETVRQYAQERLDESGEGGDARTRHLDYYLAFAEKARPELVGPNQAAWLARLDLERENLMSAHAWCNSAGDGAELGLRLVSAMRRYWIVRGLPGLGYGVTVEALGRPGASGRSKAHFQALFDAGQLCTWMGRYSEAQRYLEESLAIARKTADRGMLAKVLQPLGLASFGQGHLDVAREQLGEALALARELGNKREVAAASNALAQVHRTMGELDTALLIYQDVLARARDMGDHEIIGISLLNLAMVSIGSGDVDRAREMLVEVLAIVEETGAKPLGQSLLEVCTGLAAAREDWARAAMFYGAVEAQTAQTGLRRDRADEAFLAPLVAKTRGVLGAAAYAAAEADGRGLSYEVAMARATAVLSERG